MELRDLQFIQASTVLVHQNAKPKRFTLEELRKLLDAEVVANPIQAESGMTGLLINIPRDQIDVASLPSRVDVLQRGNPDPRGGDFTRLSQVTSIMYTFLQDAEVRAFGMNFELSFDTPGEPAFPFIAAHALSADIRRDLAGMPCSGATVKILYGDDNDRISFSLEPRFNEVDTTRVYVNGNRQRMGGSVPDAGELSGSLATSYALILEALESLP